MTPPARLSAAIAILDAVLAGASAERALTNWGRASRYAGSGDRLAVRDLVFDALRCRRSFAVLGGAETGRGLMLGRLRAAGEEAEALFTGEGHAPAPLTQTERAPPRMPTGLEALDCPDWLAPQLRDSLGARFAPVMEALRHRAPVHLRVNLRQGTAATAVAALGGEGIEVRPHPLSPTALEVVSNPRKVQASAAYLSGLVEVQDAASQAVADLVPLSPGDRVLDLCAGGGGKTLALAGRVDARFFAHDADPARMRDLPARAGRAGVMVTQLATDRLDGAAPFATVLVDAPCSGSGSWRRSPEGKWALTPARLAELQALQASILDRAARLVGPQGCLAYATCSLLDAENGAQIAGFVARTPGWTLTQSRQITPLEGGDGFFVSILRRI